MKTRIFFILGILFLFSCQSKTSKTAERSSIDTGEVEFTKEGELAINSPDGEVRLKLEIEIAETDYEQETGLMYRKSMAENQGMLFVYDDERPRPNFYMKNTYIALDLLYISGENEVVDINKNAKPLDESSLPSHAPAKYVLEINAGLVDQSGIEIGDKVEIRR